MKREQVRFRMERQTSNTSSNTRRPGRLMDPFGLLTPGLKLQGSCCVPGVEIAENPYRRQKPQGDCAPKETR